MLMSNPQEGESQGNSHAVRIASKDYRLYVKSASGVREGDVDEETREIKAVITTDAVDRDQEVVVTKGLNFNDFKRNPIVLFMHDGFKILGSSIWQTVEKTGRIIASTKFATTPLAEEMFQLVKEGVLRGVSIGMDWATIKRRDITEADVKSRNDWAGAKTIIESANVMEYSFVSIPANQEALVRAYEKGIVKYTAPYLPRPERKCIVRVPVQVTPVAEVKQIPVVRPVKHLTFEEAKQETKRAVLFAQGKI